ncbi:MAG: hypothetical protein ACOYX1_04730 [Acidobacteriota bacterium]
MQLVRYDRSVRLLGKSLALIAAVAGLAAGQQPPEKMVLTFTEIKPEKIHEFNAVRKEWSAALKKGGASWARFWNPGAIGPAYVHAQVTPIAGFAAFDGPSPLRRALSDTEFERLMARMRECTVSVRREVIEPIPDLGFRGDGAADAKLAMIVEITTHPGKRYAFLDLVRQEIMPALRKARVSSFQTYQVLAGANAERIFGVIGMPNYAALDGGNFLEQALGPDGARKLNEKYSGIAMSVSRVVLQLNSDMSFGAPTAAAAVSGSR